MPSEFKFNKVERYCHPCPHLKFENAFYGHDFVRGTHVCYHPDANDFGPLSKDPIVAAKQGELRAKLRDHGRVIGKHGDHQPTWCPLKNKLSK